MNFYCLSFLLLQFRLTITVADNVDISNIRNYEGDNLWHSYKFGHGSKKREELELKEIREFEVSNLEFHIEKWFSNKLIEGFVVGIARLKNDYSNSIFVSCIFEKNNFKNHQCQHQDLNGKILTLTIKPFYVHNKNRNGGHYDIFIIAALMKNSGPKLEWYKLDDKDLKLSQKFEWSLNCTPKKILVFEKNKILILNEIQPYQTIDLYEFIILNKTINMWLSFALNVTNVNQVALSNTFNNHIYLTTISTKDNYLISYKYQHNRFHVIFDKKLPRLSHLIPFEIGLEPFLALAGGEHLHIVKILSHPHYGHTHKWTTIEKESSIIDIMAVPVSTYRNEVILLFKSKQSTQIVAWNLNDKFKIVDTLTTNCVTRKHDNTHHISNDLDCIQHHTFKDATGVILGSDTILLFPTKLHKNNNITLNYKIITAIKHVNSPVQDELESLYNQKQKIQTMLDSQLEIITKININIENSLKYKGDFNINDTFWSINLIDTKHIEIIDKFQSKEIFISNLKLDQFQWENINDVNNNISQVEQKIKSMNQLIPDKNGNLEIPLNIEIRGNINVDGFTNIQNAYVNFINNYSTNELLNEVQRCDEVSIELKQLQVNNLIVKETINGEKFGEIASKNNNITLFGIVVFTKPVIVGDIILDDTHLTDSKLRRSKEIIANNNDISEESYENIQVEYINGIHWNTFIEQLIPLNSTESIDISSKFTIENLEVDSINVEYLNNLKFPEEYVLKGHNAEISHVKHFAGKVISHHLNILGSINSVPFDLYVTLDTKQELLGNWTVNNLTVSGDFIVINDTNEEFHEMQIVNDLTHSSNIIFTNLNIEKNINMLDHSFLAQFVYDNEKQAIILAPKHFQGEIFIDNLELEGSINNYSVRDFLTTDSVQTIHGNVIFNSPIHIHELQIDGLVQNIDITSLFNNSIMLSTDENIHSQLIFKDPVIVENSVLNITKHLNSHDRKDIVTLTDNQIIYAPYTFNDLKVTKLSINGTINTTSNIVNGKDVSAIDANRVSINGEQRINGVWDIDHVIINGNFEFGTVNQIPSKTLDAEHYLSEILKGNVLEIPHLHIVGDIDIDTVNDRSLKTIIEHAIKLNNTNYIPGHLSVNGTVTADNIFINSVLNDKFYKDFMDDFVYVYEDHITFTGTKTFKSADVNIIDAGYVNEIILPNEVLTTSTDQVIHVPLHINGTVEFHQDSIVEILNDILIEDLEKSYKYVNNTHVVTGNLIFHNHDVHVENIKFGQLIQEINIKEFLLKTVFKEFNIFINASKTFLSEIHFATNLDVNGNVNGIKFSKLKEDIVFDNKPAEIYGKIIFNSDIFVENKIMVKNDLDCNTLNGFLIQDWIDEAVYLNQQEVLMDDFTFEKITIDGPIDIVHFNNVSMKNAILLNQEQYISNTLFLERLRILQGIEVSSDINYRYLRNDYADTLLIYGDQKIKSSKIFEASVEVRGNIITNDKINNHNLQDIVTLDSDQIIYGDKHFEDVILKQDIEINGLVNSINLNDWISHVVLTDTSHPDINAVWNISNDLIIYGSVYGPETTALLEYFHIDELQDALFQHELYVKKAYKDKRDFCKNIKDFITAAENKVHLFQYLDQVQFIPILNPVLSYANFENDGNEYLILSTKGSCASMIYLWNKEEIKFTEFSSISIGEINSIIALPTSTGQVCLVTLLNSTLCSQIGGFVWNLKNIKNSELVHVHNLGDDIIRIEHSPVNKNIIYTMNKNLITYEWEYDNRCKLIQKQQITNFSNYKRSDYIINAVSTKVQNGNQTNQLDPKFTYVTNQNPYLVQSDHQDILVFDGSYKDKILLQSIPAKNPSMIKNIDFDKQNFVVFIEDNTWLKIYQYKGISGFVEVSSLYLPKSKLFGILRLSAISKKTYLLLLKPSSGLYLFEMHMLGETLTKGNKFIKLPRTCDD